MAQQDFDAAEFLLDGDVGGHGQSQRGRDPELVAIMGERLVEAFQDPVGQKIQCSAHVNCRRLRSSVSP